MKRYLLFILKDEYYYGGFQDFEKDFESKQEAIDFGIQSIKNRICREFQIFDIETRENSVYEIRQTKIINWFEKI